MVSYTGWPVYETAKSWFPKPVASYVHRQRQLPVYETAKKLVSYTGSLLHRQCASYTGKLACFIYNNNIVLLYTKQASLEILLVYEVIRNVYM